jgi:hypothetical protein
MILGIALGIENGVMLGVVLGAELVVSIGLCVGQSRPGGPPSVFPQIHKSETADGPNIVISNSLTSLILILTLRCIADLDSTVKYVIVPSPLVTLMITFLITFSNPTPMTSSMESVLFIPVKSNARMPPCSLAFHCKSPPLCCTIRTLPKSAERPGVPNPLPLTGVLVSKRRA